MLRAGHCHELVMPFANIAPEFTAANGVEFQMAMVLADRDNGDREAKLTWGGKKSINQDNSDFPTITLTGKDVVGISEKHQFSMLVYPNPVAGNRLHVSFNNVEGETGYVTLTSLHGQVVVTQTIEANEQLLVLPSGITPGMYLINLKVGENTTTQRIIIK